MKITFQSTSLGLLKPNADGQLIQSVEVLSLLTKDTGEVIRPMSDTIEVTLKSNDIEQCKLDIEQAAKDFVVDKYSG